MVTEEVIEELVCHTAIAVHTVQAMDKEMPWCGTQVQAGWKFQWVTTFWCGQVNTGQV